MRSVANRLPSLFIYLLLVVLLPASALATQAQSFMQITVQVVRGGYSAAVAALIEATTARGLSKSAINGDAGCNEIGTMIILDNARAMCSWDPDSHAYLLTVQY